MSDYANCWLNARICLCGNLEGRGKWLTDLDSNQDKGLQRALCYRYTIGQCAAKVALCRPTGKEIFAAPSRAPCYPASVTASAQYRLVRLANGVHSLHSVTECETFHPVIGPAAEAEALYVRQLRLRERLAAYAGEFVIWDVGLGAAANALTALRATRDLNCALRIISFDHTNEPLRFAIEYAEALGYLQGYEAPARELAESGRVTFADGAQKTEWELRLGDFPTLLASSVAEVLPKPHAIFFDPFSPPKNPAMWTLPLFTRLFQLLAPDQPCALPTYSRSTLLRATLLLAGFHVGAGHATGEKEETTIAANTPSLIEEPLGRRWLERARRSHSAEPLHTAHYCQAPLSPKSWEQLQQHPQFR